MKFLKSLVYSNNDSELAKLQAAVDRHQRIFQGSHGYGYFDWDLRQRRMDWSGGYWRYLGYSEEDIEYISIAANHFDYIHPDDSDRVRQGIKRILREAGPGELLYRTRRKKGGYVWTEVRADSVRDDSGMVIFLSGIAFDVTKQKQTEQALMISEARHARIIQSSNDGMWEWAAEHGGFYFSNRCWEHLGYENHTEVVTQGIDRIQAWRRRMHPDDGLEFDRALAAHVRGDSAFDVEYRVEGKDGKYRWIRARGQMTFDDHGDPLRMSGTNMDITLIKLAEEKVLKAKEVAESANRAKSEFLSSMSHELRTPLNAILGFAQLIEMDEKQSQGQKENAIEIRSAGEHLLELVGDILDLAQIEAGRLILSFESVAPINVIQECLKLLKTQAEPRGIQLSLVSNDLSHRYVNADLMRLRQVFLNLIGNAIKYNRDNGRVTVICSLLEDDTFRVLVEDTGRGIPQERQSEMFQPFNRLGAERGNIEGSGVGLVVTKQLVEQMGGHIDFSCRESVGSRFWVDLPVEQMDDDEFQKNTLDILSPHYENPLDLLITEPKRILYIEDNKSNQRLLARLMSRYALVELELADDALRGLYIARTRVPDLILMDINLPKLSGYEALAVIKQDPLLKGIPVVALSANAMIKDVKRGRAQGFCDYLTKPLNLEHLLFVLNELLVEELS